MKLPSATGDTNKIAVRSLIVELMHGCGLPGIWIDKEDIKKQLAMLQFLRFAMRNSIGLQDPDVDESSYLCLSDGEDSAPPSSPMVVFIKPDSGGRHGLTLKEHLQQLINNEQAFRFQVVPPR